MWEDLSLKGKDWYGMEFILLGWRMGHWSQVLPHPFTSLDPPFLPPEWRPACPVLLDPLGHGHKPSVGAGFNLFGRRRDI